MKDEHEFIDAAIEAEQATGVHETDEEAARAHLLVRAARVTAGTAIVLLGLALVVLPGPGVLLVLAGLSLLAIDVPFAARLHTALIARGTRATRFLPRPVRNLLIIAALLTGAVTSLLIL